MSEVLEAMVELVKRELLVVEEITVDSVSHLSFSIGMLTYQMLN